MVPRVWIQPIIDSLLILRDVVHDCGQRQAMVNLYKCSISIITETLFAIQTQVTTQLYGTSTCLCNNNRVFSETAIFTFLTVDVCRSARACWPGSDQALVMHAKVARSRHSWIYYFLCFKFRFCLTTVSNIMTIVKWCSGVACIWCVSLDIGLILALKFTFLDIQLWFLCLLFVSN